jgi:hypothetical protein
MRARNVVESKIGQQLRLDRDLEGLSVFLRDRPLVAYHRQELIASTQGAEDITECSWFHGVPEETDERRRRVTLTNCCGGFQV